VAAFPALVAGLGGRNLTAIGKFSVFYPDNVFLRRVSILPSGLRVRAAVATIHGDYCRRHSSSTGVYKSDRFHHAANISSDLMGLFDHGDCVLFLPTGLCRLATPRGCMSPETKIHSSKTHSQCSRRLVKRFRRFHASTGLSLFFFSPFLSPSGEILGRVGPKGSATTADHGGFRPLLAPDGGQRVTLRGSEDRLGVGPSHRLGHRGINRHLPGLPKPFLSGGPCAKTHQRWRWPYGACSVTPPSMDETGLKAVPRLKRGCRTGRAGPISPRARRQNKKKMDRPQRRAGSPNPGRGCCLLRRTRRPGLEIPGRTRLDSPGRIKQACQRSRNGDHRGEHLMGSSSTLTETRHRAQRREGNL